jgi:hypothetical protein
MERVEGRGLSGQARLTHGLALLGYTQMHPRVIKRHHGTSRLWNPRKVRQTLACSTVPRYPRWMRWLAVGLDNCCRGHSS